MLAVANHFLLFHMPRNVFQENLFHGSPKDESVLETTLLVEIIPASM